MSTTFIELGVPRAMADGLALRGINEPFPIQVAALPAGLAGRDVCGRAPTGSGKTIAFGIPLVTRVGRGRPRRPRALVLVPTRELAAQVASELAQLGGPKGATVATFYGGVGYGPQVGALRRGVDIAVACPGRLSDLAERGEVHLGDVEIVVVDEADRMADMGFMPQVRRLLDQVGPKRQTMLFSATLDGDAAELTRRYQTDPARIEAVPVTDAPSNRHLFWWADGSERTDLTTKVVGTHWPALVFCRTKHGADRLAQKLNNSGIDAAAMHGDRSQAQRDRALAAFVSGRVQVLVATDVAARGIHVDDIACVVNFDPPEDDKAYVHRSGRTGRAGRTGLVLSLVSSAQAADMKKLQAKLRLPRAIDRPDLEAIKPASDAARVRPAPLPYDSDAGSVRPFRSDAGRPRSGGPRGGAPRWGQSGGGSSGGTGGGGSTSGRRSESRGGPGNRPSSGQRPRRAS